MRERKRQSKKANIEQIASIPEEVREKIILADQDEMKKRMTKRHQ